LIATGFAVCSRKAAPGFIEAPDVGIPHRCDEVAIERGEFVDVVGHCFPSHQTSLAERNEAIPDCEIPEPIVSSPEIEARLLNLRRLSIAP